MRDRVLVVAYHNVIPDDVAPAGDLPNHLPLRRFVAQVEALSATHSIVSLDDAVKAGPDRAGRPRAVITFDDAYRGAVQYAVPELARRGLPATIFVAPARLGDQQFWWDTLARPDGTGLDPVLRTSALGALHGEEDAILAEARRAEWPLARMGAVFRSSTLDELTAALGRTTGIVLGSHSWSHANLSQLSDDALAIELSRPLEWLRARVEPSTAWIAYPYGAFDRRVALAAELAGYSGGLGISGGWIPRAPTERMALPRLNIPPGLSQAGFLLRSSGLLCE